MSDLDSDSSVDSSVDSPIDSPIDSSANSSTNSSSADSPVDSSESELDSDSHSDSESNSPSCSSDTASSYSDGSLPPSRVPRPNSDDPAHVIALFDSCCQGDIDQVKALLSNSSLSFDNLPLHCAVESEQLQILKLFLEDPRCDVNQVDEGDATAFCLACDLNNLPMVKLFAKDPRVDLSLCDSEGLTGFQIACQSGNLGVVRYLSQHPRIGLTGNEFELACSAKRVDVMMFLANDPRIDVNAYNTEGRPYRNAIERVCEVDEDIDFLQWMLASDAEFEMTYGNFDAWGEDFDNLLQSYLANPAKWRTKLQKKFGISSKKAFLPMNPFQPQLTISPLNIR